jgi:hypothetical protein
MDITKRLSNSSDYDRPERTITELIQNKKDILEQLKNYEEIKNDDLCYICFNTYLKYLTYNKKTKKEMFRFGGKLIKIDTEYIVLAGKEGMRFSVQRYTKDDKGNILHITRFFKKMNLDNIEEIDETKKEEIKKKEEEIKIRKLKKKLSNKT